MSRKEINQEGSRVWLERLSDSAFQLSDLPDSGRMIVEAYAAGQGRPVESFSSKATLTACALEQALKAHFESFYPRNLSLEELTSQECDKDIVRLLLKWARYLEPAKYGASNPRKRVQAARFLRSDEKLRALLPASWTESVFEVLHNSVDSLLSGGRGGGALQKMGKEGYRALDAFVDNALLLTRASVPFVVPSRPSPHVHRKDAHEALVAGIEECPGGWAPFAITGRPGAGKATLAAAFAREVQRLPKFFDGVFWIPLGEEPQLLPYLRWLATRFGAQLSPGPISADYASSRLQEVLEQRSVLLFLVDAWQAEHVRPFLVGGKRCRVLVTTSSSVADDLILPQQQQLPLKGMTPQEGLRLVEDVLGDQWDDDAYRAFKTIGEEVSWSPYIVKHLARIGARGEWEDLIAQFERTKGFPQPNCRPQWQEMLDVLHEVWLQSLGDNASLVVPWANAPWFSSFDLKVVQAVYGVEREIAAERLGILASFDLVRPVRGSLGGTCYRWEPLMWDFIRRRLGSPTDGVFEWVRRYDGGWGQGPLWRISVPGRSVWALQPWNPRHWGPGAESVSLNGARRLVINMPQYAIEHLSQKRLEWSAEAWATWRRLARRTPQLCWLWIGFLALLLIGHYLAYATGIYFGLVNWWISIWGSLSPALWSSALATILLPALPMFWMLIAHIVSCLRAMERWVYGEGG